MQQMDIWTGYLDNTGTPCLKIRISGPLSKGEEFEAIIDTGFTGFLAMPLLKAFPLGLILYGTTEVTLADGSASPKLTAKAGVTVTGGDLKIGVAVLEPTSTDILVGMDFLQKFERVLFVHTGDPDGVMLMARKDFDELRTQRAAKKAKGSKRKVTTLPAPPATSK